MENNRRTLASIFILLVVLWLALAAVAVKAILLKTFSAKEYRERFKQEKIIDVPAIRGNILSRDNRQLACSVPSYRIAIDPSADGLPDAIFNAEIGKLSECLANFFGEHSASEYKEIISKARVSKKRYLLVSSRWVTHSEFNIIKEFPIFQRGKNKGGFIPEKIEKRTLPFGLLGQRTVGRLDGEKKTPNCGLEEAYDKELRGTAGKARQRRIAGRNVADNITDPIDGLDVVSSIDVDIQDVAETSLLNQLNKLDADHGVAILMEVKTGFVRAIVNLHRSSDGKYFEDYNYAIGESAEPGSTMKLATMMACLEDGLVTPNDTINTFDGEFRFFDRVMKDSKKGGHGVVTFQEAFEVSSNIAFSRLAVQCYGADKQHYISRLHDFGLCDDLGLELKGEKSTYIKSPSDPKWSGTTLPWMSIGYEMSITPLQILTFYNAVANNGTMMRPLFVERLTKQGRTVKTMRPHVMRNSIASRKTINAVHKMLSGVVEHGTAKNISGTPYGIAGKTGTAQIADQKGGYGKRQYLASFAGYFPANEPLYSCIVMVYGPNNLYYGNVVAGSVVKDIADRVYASEFRKGAGKIQPQAPSSGFMPWSKAGAIGDVSRVFTDLHIAHTAWPSATQWVSTTARATDVAVSARHFVNGRTPNVMGMGAADAVTLLEELGYKVSLTGYGRVTQQTPAPDTPISAGATVTIVLKP